ncbi:MAG: DMT family transporter [Clostridia bacterium]|nr:DMT family transporter [Clostridia bacterium]MBR5742798.1 DMT family transporter [Clostridia bacterium]
MKKRSLILLSLTAVIWGFSFTAQRLGGDHVGVFTFDAVRFFLAGLAVAPFTFLAEKKTPAKGMKVTWIAGFAAGAILTAAQALQQYGIVLTQSAGKAGFITGLYILLVPLFGILLRKKLTPMLWFASPMALVGLWLLTWDGTGGVTLGDGVLLAGAVLWAAHILLIDGVGDRIYPLRFSLIQFFVSAALNALFLLFFERPTAADLSSALIPLLYSGILSSGMGFTLQVLGQKGADPAIASLVLSFEAVFSAVGGALILGETMTPLQILGCALMFGAILLCQIKPFPFLRPKR